MVVPEAVVKELRAERSRDAVRQFLSNRPQWLVLGVLRIAADKGWVDLAKAVDGLEQANFYFSDTLRKRIVKID